MSVMTDCILPVSLVFHQEAMDMLVFNAQKLNNAVKETVRAAEAASIRVRLYFFLFSSLKRNNIKKGSFLQTQVLSLLSFHCFFLMFCLFQE